MIKKVLFTLSIATLSVLTAKAQPIDPCGTDDVYRRQLALHPEIAENEVALKEEILKRLAMMDLSKFSKTTAEGEEYHVPIVYHIIHDYGAEFITDASVVASVARINDMFNKRNADTSGIIAPFKGTINNSTKRYIGNARITWHLATKAPDGSPTNGITRRRSYTSLAATDLAKYDQWPPSNYMNIWVIRAFKPSSDGFKPAAYAYKPATADLIPYYDGVITLYNYVNEANTLTHELGHELNLDHVWGSNNDPGEECGDDEVDDTPFSKGHTDCSAATLYDTTCLTTNQTIAKVRFDSIRRPDLSVIFRADTSTSKGITFINRTAGYLDSVVFYPTAAIGSTYKIGLLRNNILIDSSTVVTTVIGNPEKVKVGFTLPSSDTSIKFRLFFLQNPGALRDTVTPGLSAFNKGTFGSVQIQNFSNDNFYNYFYSMKIRAGFFKVYSGSKGDSLVDYPDTTNSQNVMEYSFCPHHMFTNGQVDRMRAALTSSGKGSANRANLITAGNLDSTGALATYPNPLVKPMAEFSVDPGRTDLFPANGLSYFLAKKQVAGEHSFVFRDRTWQATPTKSTWSATNTPSNTTPAGSTLRTDFADIGWTKVTLTTENANGATSFTDSVYNADPVAMNPIGFFQEFTNDAENARWPIFNYYNNRYKWEITNSGFYDAKCIRYRSFDDRMSLKEQVNGDASGDYDDFFTPAFDLSTLGVVNGNLNFVYAGAYATNNLDYMKDTLLISYSTDGGGNWLPLKTMRNTEMQTVGSVPTSSREYTPAYNEWKPMSIDLKSGASTIRNPRVYFRFRYKPSSRPVGPYAYASGNNFYIDRINISDYPLGVNEMMLGDKKAGVAPNPTNSSSFVLVKQANAHVNVQVMDIAGKVVYTVSTSVTQNNGSIEIPATYISAKGVYVVRITGDNNLNQTEKLVVY